MKPIKTIRNRKPGWWLGHPSEKYELVNWDDYSQYFWENKTWQPNHQAETAVSGTAMRRVEEPRIDQGKWDGIIKQDVGMSPQNRQLTKSMVLWRQAISAATSTVTSKASSNEPAPSQVGMIVRTNILTDLGGSHRIT